MASAGEFLIKVDRLPHVVITVAGELDLHTAPELDGRLDEFTEDSGLVVLDMSGVTYFDSTGLATMWFAVERDVDLRVVGSPAVVQAVRLAGLDARVKLYDSVSAAVGESP